MAASKRWHVWFGGDRPGASTTGYRWPPSDRSSTVARFIPSPLAREPPQLSWEFSGEALRRVRSCSQPL